MKDCCREARSCGNLHLVGHPDHGNCADMKNGLTLHPPHHHVHHKSTNGLNYSTATNTSSSGGSSSTNHCHHRPPFITTVKRGKFLPSKFELMMEEKSLIFSFSSRPRTVDNGNLRPVKKHTCSLLGVPSIDPNTIPPRGAHDYYNMMFDPHIFRGRATTKSVSPIDGPTNDHDASTKARKKRSVPNHTSTTTTTTTTTATAGDSSGGEKYKVTTRVTTRSNKGVPKIGYLPKKQQSMFVQTDQFLQDLSGEENLVKEERNVSVQTEPTYDDALTLNDDLHGRHAKTGIDIATQVEPGELFDFEEEVKPIVETLVGRILHQALLETMEEEELGALKAQQHRFLQRREEESQILNRLKET